MQFDAFVDFHQSLINSPTAVAAAAAAGRAIHLGNLHQNAFRSVIYLARGNGAFGKTKHNHVSLRLFCQRRFLRAASTHALVFVCVISELIDA
jgi:hypothetical protein